ncbi:GNAT family N-acetyltransferase [Paenibacillus sacheonensis]|uniref:GNAT family N-acetyltransferase n=1 Tax=Paenibacillus sacheonensis TaxID=742054 RepID=A0A7X5BX76_9BACL|nr:GNAT family N-acetyltransferase [Paenibacillus sacheonensis]MBM7565058.1 ribosomal-protein-alanine N-acetyltransferase [Paenibacillus sacheonensis]NBC70158.1 GNAT family N-acetyltransferase [Paenibacillus sacheonensis]
MKLRTKRLVVEACTPGNVGRVSETYAIGTHIVNYIERLQEDPELLGWGVWFVSLADTGQVVGDIGFKGKPDYQGMAEVGFGFIPAMHNKGMATESVEAITEWAFATGKANRITAECLVDNLPSARVLEKLGMKRTGAANGMVNWELLGPPKRVQ